MIDSILSALEIERVTGYKRPSDQLQELHRQGFYRARRSPTTGNIIVERVHYDSVCVGAHPANQPRVRVPQLRTV